VQFSHPNEEKYVKNKVKKQIFRDHFSEINLLVDRIHILDLK